MGLFRRSPSEPVSRVRMLVSVGGDHVAGEQYDLPVSIADRYVALGYAAGELSRAYTPDELASLRGRPPQIIRVGH